MDLSGLMLLWNLSLSGPAQTSKLLTFQTVKNLPAMAGDPGLIPGWGRFPGEGNGYALQYSCLENPMDREAWQETVHGVTKSHTRLSDFTFHFHALEKEVATHSSVLAWRIPGTGEPGGLPSVGSHRVGHDWSDLAAAAEQFSQAFSRLNLLLVLLLPQYTL